MAIDMNALRAAATGDPDGRVTVNRRYLGEVHKLLVQADADAAALASLRRRRTDQMSDIFGDVFRNRT